VSLKLRVLVVEAVVPSHTAGDHLLCERIACDEALAGRDGKRARARHRASRPMRRAERTASRTSSDSRPAMSVSTCAGRQRSRLREGSRRGRRARCSFRHGAGVRVREIDVAGKKVPFRLFASRANRAGRAARSSRVRRRRRASFARAHASAGSTSRLGTSNLLAPGGLQLTALGFTGLMGADPYRRGRRSSRHGRCPRR